MEWKETTNSIEVPPNTGIDGFLYALKELLKRPRLQEIVVDARGKITYRQYVREDLPQSNIGLDFDHLSPGGVIRNAEAVELEVREGQNAGVILASMIDISISDQLHPVGFATGSNTVLWAWYRSTTGAFLRSKTTLLGLPLYTDRQIPDTALILCSAYGKDSSMIDTQRAYKVEMTIDFVPPETTVEILE